MIRHGDRLCVSHLSPYDYQSKTSTSLLPHRPYHWCVLAGAALQAGAATAGRVVSKTLTDRYLLRANKTFFEPRGLKVRLMKTAAVRRFVNAEAPQAEKSKWKKFGESAGRTAHIVGTRLPVTGKVIAMFAKPVRNLT